MAAKPITVLPMQTLSEASPWWKSDLNLSEAKCNKIVTRNFIIYYTRGRAIAQAASHRGGQSSNPDLVMWDFVMDKSGAGAGFLRELLFPLPIYIPSTSS
jgi:hypothetical protein